MNSVAHAHSMIERFSLFVYLAVCPSICSYALLGTAVVTLFLVLLSCSAEERQKSEMLGVCVRTLHVTLPVRICIAV